MNISEVEQTILDIETRSQEAHRGSFQLASNGKFIIKSELEGYEELLKDLEAIKVLEQYVQEHKAIIDQYRRLQDRVNAIDTPAFINQKRAESVEQSPVAEVDIPVQENEPVEIPVNEMAEERTSGTPEPSVESDQLTQGENPENMEPVQNSEVPTPIEMPVAQTTEPVVEKETIQTETPTLIEDVQNPEYGDSNEKSQSQSDEPVIKDEKVTPEFVEPKQPVVEPEKKISPITDFPTFNSSSEPALDPNSYRLRRGEIIQDLPINDLSKQTFKTVGMLNDDIKASQEKINSIPTVDPITYIDPIQAEIDRRKAEWDKAQGKTPEAAPYKPMTPEEIEAARRKIGESDPVKKGPETTKGPGSPSGKTPGTGTNPVTPEPPKDDKKKKGKKRKVTKRKKFDWKNNFITQGFNKAYLVVKGLVFSENMNGRTKDYVSICIAMGNYRAAYKSRTPEVNNKELEALDRSITSSTMLTLEEKKRLYKKLTKLARQVERQNHKQQSKAMKESEHLVEELTEDVSKGR